MSISKKIRKKVVVKEAPLSFLDGTLYIIFILLLVLLVFTPMILFAFVLPEQYTYANEAVIAFDNEDQWELFLSFPFSLSLLFLFIFPLAHLGFGHRPIFGNPHYKPKARESIIHKEPFISKAFWKNLSQDTIDDVKKKHSLAV